MNKLETLKHFIDGDKLVTPHENILKIKGVNIINQDGDRWYVKDALNGILNGDYKLYEEKPQLVWHKVTQSRIGGGMRNLDQNIGQRTVKAIRLSRQ